MNDGFKQRLIGAIVLGSLALILWPMVFTHTAGPMLDKRSQIPEPPLFEKFTVGQPVRVANVDPVVSDDDYTGADVGASAGADVSADTNSGAAASTGANGVEAGANQIDQKTLPDKKPRQAEQPVLDEKGLPIAWVLQVASFQKQANAEQLKQALQQKGYKAYTRRVKTREGESVRIYVGPALTKSALEDDKKAIDKAFKLRSLIVRFTQ